MNAASFHLALARDSCENATESIRCTHIKAGALAWIKCAKRNLALAEAALKQRPTLKPLRLRSKGGRA